AGLLPAARRTRGARRRRDAPVRTPARRGRARTGASPLAAPARHVTAAAAGGVPAALAAGLVGHLRLGLDALLAHPAAHGLVRDRLLGGHPDALDRHGLRGDHGALLVQRDLVLVLLEGGTGHGVVTVGVRDWL